MQIGLLENKKYSRDLQPLLLKNPTLPAQDQAVDNWARGSWGQKHSSCNSW